MNIYEQAIEKWGTESQVNMAIEECAELTVALRHYARGKAYLAQVASEVADVEIMMSQLRILLGDKTVEAHKEKKLARLAERIADRPQAAREG